MTTEHLQPRAVHAKCLICELSEKQLPSDFWKIQATQCDQRF